MPYFNVHVVWIKEPTKALPTPPAVAVQFECLTASNSEDAKRNALAMLWSFAGCWKVVEIKEL